MIELDYTRSGATTKLLGKIDEVESASETNFVELVKISGLNPKQDFLKSNLSRVDFTNCDLRSFDFSGADLRGAFGRNIRMPSAAALEGALTDGSPFGYVRVLAQIEARSNRRYPVGVISNSDALTSSAWIFENTKLGAARRDDAILSVLANFEICEEPTILTDSIYAAWDFFDNVEDFLAFLLGVISRPGIAIAPCTAAVRLLGARFSGLREVQDLLFSILRGSERIALRVSALRELLVWGRRNRMEARVWEEIMLSEQRELRQHLLNAAIGIHRRDYAFFLGERHGGVFDYAQPISSQFFAEACTQMFDVASLGSESGLFDLGGYVLRAGNIRSVDALIRSLESFPGIRFKYSEELTEALRGARTV